MPKFTCEVCKIEFSISDQVLERFPGWKPKYCMEHSKSKKTTENKPKKSITATKDLSPQEVLDRFKDGPQTGLFTDGCARPNPGPGAWAAILVIDGELKKEYSGKDPETTNNRMELTALINGINDLPKDLEIDVYSDSELCVNIVNKWIFNWKKNNWKKKTGEIANLDLIKKLDQVINEHPKVSLKWIKAHSGWRWNEYVDALATSSIFSEE